jgi:ABC-type sulfate transport system permease component
MLLILALIGQMTFFLSVLFVSARSTIKSKSIVKGAFLLYGLSVAAVFLFCVVIPGLLISLGANRHVVVHSFPESIVGMPIVLGGWILGLIFATLVRAAHILVSVLRRKTGQQQENAG